MENNRHTVITLLPIVAGNKASEFYIDRRGFRIDRAHRYGENLPLYRQVAKDHIRLHRTEQYADGCPGATLFTRYAKSVVNYHASLTEKAYRYYKPAPGKTPWKMPQPDGIDLLSNKCCFAEDVKAGADAQ